MQARVSLEAGDRGLALRQTARAALLAPQDAGAFYQAGVLVDSHSLPQHDEAAYRCIAQALRLAPGEPIYRRETTIRLIHRGNAIQLMRQIANLPLLPALLLGGLGEQLVLLRLLLLLPAWAIALPGLLMHLLIRVAVVWPLCLLLGKRIVARVSASPSDDALIDLLSGYARGP